MSQCVVYLQTGAGDRPPPSSATHDAINTHTICRFGALNFNGFGPDATTCAPVSSTRRVVAVHACKAGIPPDPHGHRHRRGHPRLLAREDRREDVGVSDDFHVQPQK